MKTFLENLDEINQLTTYSYEAGSSASEIKNDILSMLIRGYKDGVDSVEEMLEMSGYNSSLKEMNASIYKEIEGKTFEDRIQTHLDNEDLRGLVILAESEYHRVYNEAAQNTASKAQGNIVKTWVTIGDDKVRETHDYLELETIGVNEEFYTYDGDHALYPGGFTTAQNNVNCRCVVEYKRL